MPRGAKNPLNHSTGSRLFRVRERTGLSGTRCSREAGLSSSAILRIEDGSVAPALDTLERIAAVIGILPGWLAYGHEGTEVWRARRPRSPLPLDDPELETSLRAFKALHRGCGARIRQVREEAGLSMRALARAAGVSVQAVINAESGATAPRIDTLESIARALFVAPAWLAYGEGDGPS